MLSFGFMAVLIAVVGYVTLSGLATLGGMIDLLNHRDAAALSAIKDANLAVVSIARDTRGVLMPVDAATRQRYSQATARSRGSAVRVRRLPPGETERRPGRVARDSFR
jgi:hypothetical protein